MTPNDFRSSKFKLGPFAKYFYVAAAFFNAIVFSVQVSPFFFPVTAETFNFVSGFITRLSSLVNADLIKW